ncbi:hypothetical protein EKK58_02830 [Candidatus Dependentiae bacterium]|nr:MAG: hypothetical protein EKK58_02830 [Candidatus Dependentiae bacterium]
MYSQLLLVTDAVRSQVGRVCQIPVNDVCFIPHNIGAHLKIYPERAVTLHQFIPGKDLDSQMPTCITNYISVK